MNSASKAMSLWPPRTDWDDLPGGVQKQIGDLTKAHIHQQDALIRAKKRGLALDWLRGWDHLHLDEIGPTPKGNPKSGRVIFLPSDIRVSKRNRMSAQSMRPKLTEDREWNGGWDNAVMAMEGAA